MARVEFCVADGVAVAEKVKRVERMFEAEFKRAGTGARERSTSGSIRNGA